MSLDPSLRFTRARAQSSPAWRACVVTCVEAPNSTLSCGPPQARSPVRRCAAEHTQRARRSLDLRQQHATPHGSSPQDCSLAGLRLRAAPRRRQEPILCAKRPGRRLKRSVCTGLACDRRASAPASQRRPRWPFTRDCASKTPDRRPGSKQPRCCRECDCSGRERQQSACVATLCGALPAHSSTSALLRLLWGSTAGTVSAAKGGARWRRWTFITGLGRQRTSIRHRLLVHHPRQQRSAVLKRRTRTAAMTQRRRRPQHPAERSSRQRGASAQSVALDSSPRAAIALDAARRGTDHRCGEYRVSTFC